MDSPGLVYYVLDATRLTQRVKIGFTTNLVDRLASLRGQTVSGQQPLLLALEPGGLDVERERHRQFAEWRLGGEWFTYADPVRTFVASLSQPDALLADSRDLWWFARGWRGVPTTTQPIAEALVALAAVDLHVVVPVQF